MLRVRRWWRDQTPDERVGTVVLALVIVFALEILAMVGLDLVREIQEIRGLVKP